MICAKYAAHAFASSVLSLRHTNTTGVRTRLARRFSVHFSQFAHLVCAHTAHAHNIALHPNRQTVGLKYEVRTFRVVHRILHKAV